MKICLFNLTAGFKAGGLETFTWGIAKALRDLGNEVEVVAGAGGDPACPPGVKLVRFPYRERNRFPDFGTRFRKLAERLSFARHAAPYVAAAGFDVVLINKPYDFPVLWWLKRQGYAGVTCYNSGGTEFFRGDRWLARAVDLWLPCSQFNAGRVQVHYGCDYTLLYNGVDADLFRPEGERRDLHALFSIPAGAAVAVSVGRLVGLKGLHIVVEALASLPELHYVVIGAGPERERLEKLAASLGVAGRVHFAGEVKQAELPPWLRGADFFVQPSISEEAFGISVAEAMSCGLPVVASRGWGLKEVVVEGGTGLFAEPGDVANWRRAIAHLAADREAARRMGRAGRERVLANFTWTASAAVLLARVEEIAAAAGRRPQEA